LAGINRVCFYLYKPGTKYPVYTIRLLVLTKGNEIEKKIFENARDYFVFDTKDELLGIFDFVYGILKQYVYSFYCENLDKEIDNYFEIIDKIKREKYKNTSKEELYKIGHEMGKKWNEVRFFDRKHL
jgi:predicted hydrocarbon binding protein